MEIVKNNYNIFGIKCDRFGNPKNKITDEIMAKIYFEKLMEFYTECTKEQLIREETKRKIQESEKEGITLDERTLKNEVRNRILSEEVQSRMFTIQKNDQRFAELVRTDKTIQEAIKILENMLESSELIQVSELSRQTYQLYKSAYESLKTEEKRKAYEEKTKKEVEGDEKKTIKKTPISLKFVEESSKDIEYLTIHQDESLGKVYRMLYGSENTILLEKNKYFALLSREIKKVSDIKTEARLERENLIEYSLLRKGKDGKWKEFNFMSDMDIGQQFSRAKRREEKEIYFRAIVKAVREMMASKRTMLGKISQIKQENTDKVEWEEKYNSKLAGRVKQYYEEKKQNKGEVNQWAR